MTIIGVPASLPPSIAAIDPVAIELTGLARDYGNLPVLRDVSLRLETGQTLAVLGPNGAGKSTLIRILATLLRPGAGSAAVLGATLPRDAWRARGRIGLLGHQPMLYRDLTVAEALRFHARLHSIADPDARIAELLAAVRLERHAGQPVRTLSAGQLQRASVCRAVLHDPELLLLDEPHSHLDPVGAAIVDALIGRQSQATRVIVTHDVEGGLADADRALVLSAGGHVAYEGPADAITAAQARAVYTGKA